MIISGCSEKSPLSMGKVEAVVTRPIDDEVIDVVLQTIVVPVESKGEDKI